MHMLWVLLCIHAKIEMERTCLLRIYVELMWMKDTLITEKFFYRTELINTLSAGAYYRTAQSQDRSKSALSRYVQSCRHVVTFLLNTDLFLHSEHRSVLIFIVYFAVFVLAYVVSELAYLTAGVGLYRCNGKTPEFSD